MDRAELEALSRAPFKLYGLDDRWPGARSIASYAFDDNGVPSQIGLGHGVREDPSRPWVEVTVLGPLHGETAGNWAAPGGSSWWLDPDPLALFYVAVRSDPSLSGEELSEAQDRLKDRMASIPLSVDGELLEFDCVRENAHWGAVRRTETDHAIVICASHILPDAVRLTTISSLDAYIDGEEPAA